MSILSKNGPEIRLRYRLICLRTGTAAQIRINTAAFTWIHSGRHHRIRRELHRPFSLVTVIIRSSIGPQKVQKGGRKLRQLVEKQNAVCRQGYLPRPVPPPASAWAVIPWCGLLNGLARISGSSFFNSPQIL